jgi:hypothetical protein
MNDHASPEVAAVETVGGVLTDLVEVAERLPVPPGQARDVARILDRLAEEIGQAAGMLRVVSGAVSGPAGPVYSPWAVVRLVTRELVREGVKVRFGPEADLSEVCGQAARLLEALGVVPVVPADDPAGLSIAFPSWRTAPAGRPRVDGSVPAGGDERVIQARMLLAEHHQPLTMTPGDLRKLLARYRLRVRELLEVAGSPAITEHERS